MNFSATPQAKIAHKLTQAAIKDGRLVRQPCEICGDPRSHAHHPDYDQPLNVQWLCNRHHTQLHAALNDMPGYLATKEARLHQQARMIVEARAKILARSGSLEAPPLWSTLQGLVNRWDVAESTVQYWIDQGALRFHAFGGNGRTRRYAAKDVVAFEAEAVTR